MIALLLLPGYPATWLLSFLGPATAAMCLGYYCCSYSCFLLIPRQSSQKLVCFILYPACCCVHPACLQTPAPADDALSGCTLLVAFESAGDAEFCGNCLREGAWAAAQSGSQAPHPAAGKMAQPCCVMASHSMASRAKCARWWSGCRPSHAPAMLIRAHACLNSATAIGGEVQVCRWPFRATA